MKRILILLALAVAMLFPAAVSSQVAISASNVTNALQQHVTARLCFMPVNAAGTPSGFRVGSAQVIPLETCGTVTSGALQSGLHLIANPTGFYYHVTVKGSNSSTVIRDMGMTAITGSTWSLDSYDPATMAVVPSLLTVGSVTALEPGATPTAALAGSAPGPYTLNLGIPQGPTGATGADGVGTVDTVARAAAATAQATADAGAKVLPISTSPFADRSTSPVLVKGGTYDGWTADAQAAPGVAWDGTSFRMTTSLWSSANSKWASGFFTSPDMIHWTYLSSSLRAPTGSDYLLGNGGMVYWTPSTGAHAGVGAYYFLYAHYGPSTASTDTVSLDRSTDTTLQASSWTNVVANVWGSGTYFSDCKDVVNPNNNKLELWCVDFLGGTSGAYMADSADGVTFTNEGLQWGGGTGSILAVSGAFHVAYAGVGGPRYATVDQTFSGVAGARYSQLLIDPLRNNTWSLVSVADAPDSNIAWKSVETFDSVPLYIDTGDGYGLTLRLVYAGGDNDSDVDATNSSIGYAIGTGLMRVTNLTVGNLAPASGSGATCMARDTTGLVVSVPCYSSFVTAGTVAVTATDNFTRSNGALGANWTGSSNITIASNKAQNTASGSGADFVWYTGATIGNDQCSQITIGTPTASGSWVGLTVRETSATHAYFALYTNAPGGASGTTSVSISKILDGSGGITVATAVSIPAAMNTGDVFKFCVAGGNLATYVNGVSKAVGTDTDIATGYPGLLLATGSPATLTEFVGTGYTVSQAPSVSATTPTVLGIACWKATTPPTLGTCSAVSGASCTACN